MTAQAAAPEPEAQEGLWARMRDAIRSGDLGSWPVLIAVALVFLYFGLQAPNFFTPVNFENLIGQMAGTCMLAYGVVFVLLIGEIDLSIGYVSGIAGVVVAELQLTTGAHLPALVCIGLALLTTTVIGGLQGSIVAYIGVPSFVVTLAGFLIWEGVILLTITQGVIVIQDHIINDVYGYFFGDLWGWVIGIVICVAYIAGTLGSALSGRRHGIPIRNPIMLVLKLAAVTAIVLGTVATLNSDRGVPFALLLVVTMLLVLTFLAKRTTFGRHVYAVGGNAEAARRAGINVPRIRVLVFMISGFMAGLGGIVFAARLNSVDLNAGGGTLLIDAISAAVIGGVSLFGGRGEIRAALIGSLLIATIANGMNILGKATGTIYITTGVILLLAVTFDTIVRQRRIRAGR
jgi:D-xylose transport system permease protein